MILHNRYLSDEELRQLILETEADMAPASPGLADDIRNLIQAEEPVVKIAKSDKKDREKGSVSIKKGDFAAYCIRVSVAVAAAVAFIFVMPNLPVADIWQGTGDFHTGMDQWEAGAMSEEQLAEYEALRSCPTKEEVLNETGFLQKVLESGNFTGSDNLDSLKEENGGK